MESRILKIRSYSKVMINRLIVADQKIALLKPLLENRRLVEKWNGNDGVHGLNLMRFILYFDLIRELSAITIDNDKRAPSLVNICRLISTKDLCDKLKEEYCKYRPTIWVTEIDPEKKDSFKEDELRRRKERFDDLLLKLKSDFEQLKQEELYIKIKNARNKLVAHYEMRNIGEQPAILDPTDLDLQWGDAEKYFIMVSPMINDLIEIISNKGYELDLLRISHEQISNGFWNCE